MSHEGAPYREMEPSVDASWYNRFENSGNFQVYEYLDGDKTEREKVQNDFINGKVENPVLDYPLLEENMDNFEERERLLLELKQDIEARESRDVVKRVYGWKINEKIAEIRMLKAAYHGDGRRFRKYSDFIYGKASEQVFSYTLEKVFSVIDNGKESENSTIQHMAQELDHLLEQARSLKGKSESIQLPDSQQKTLAQQATLSEVEDLFPENLQKGHEYIAVEIQTVFTEALQKLGAEGWKVVVDESSKSGISVDQENKAVKIPSTRKVFRKKLIALIAHEIGTHVARRENGQRSKLQLLAFGLDRYEKGEEGVATMREQAFKDDEVEEFAGFDGHFAIGLGVGIDGQPRNFRGVYEVLYRYYALKNLLAGKGEEQKIVQDAQVSAYRRCVRTFRGTHCDKPGVVFTKDIVYREGNIDVWRVVGEKPDELMRFSVGKYDPSNERHIWVLDQLGITGEDLKELEA